ncbi:hypothetical protein CSC73_14230 [Pseudoxanthomonas sacheonensis]|nr:hypothetical protein CSC73_14230 [Pseudoxanthomonas sacheonensis]
MFVRFTTLAIDPDSGHTGGILVAAHELRDGGDLTVDEHSDLRTVLSWFNEYLLVPAMLGIKEHRRAISWFKPAASEAIRRMWHLKELLDLHGVHVEVLHTSDPGKVVYEDDWQVIAKPYKGQRF